MFKCKPSHMKATFIIFLLLISGLTFSQDTSADRRPLKYFDSGTFLFERILPACTDYNAAGVPNFNVLGLEGEFLSYTFGQWRWSQRVGGTYGWRETEELISDIEFEGGYTGAFSVWDHHFNLYLGTSIAFQPHPKLEIAIPIQFSARLTRGVGKYYLYDGQNIDPSDEVDAQEANSANKVVIYSKWMPGLKTGVEVVGFPNSDLSVVGRLNYQYYGWRDVFNTATGTLNPVNQTVNFESDRVWSTPEWGFSIGLRYYFISKHSSSTRKKPKEKEDKPNVILSPKKRQ